MCPTCTREVVEFCETAAELSLLATVAAAAAEPAQQHPVGDQGGPAAAARGAAAAGRRRAGRADAPPSTAGQPAAPDDVTPAKPGTGVDELALRRQRRRTRVLTAAGRRRGWSSPWPSVAWSTACRSSARSRSAQDSSSRAGSAAKTELLAAPDVRIVSHDGANGGQVSFVVSEEPEPGHVRRQPTCPTPGRATGTSCGRSTARTRPVRTTSSTAVPDSQAVLQRRHRRQGGTGDHRRGRGHRADRAIGRPRGCHALRLIAAPI